MLYLHNWDPVDPVTKVQPVYPEVHSIHATWQEAEAEAKLASGGVLGRYWVRRGRMKSGQV